MAVELRPITRILTDYRAIAHLVEAITVFLLIIFQWIFVGAYWLQLIPIIYGIFESVKGGILLQGILKEHPTKVKIYVILSTITIVLKKILYLVWAIHLLKAVMYGVVWIVLFLLACAIIYFGYEWYLFYHVFQFYKHLRSRPGSGRMEGGHITNHENF